MSLNPKQVQILTKISDQLYDFLPGNPHPYADQSISFPGCAKRIGLGHFWRGGSKRSAISQLLISTLDGASSKFCPLILEIVRIGILYRTSKRNPIKKSEVIDLNKLIVEVGFKIPELWEPSFLDSLEPDEIRAKKQEGVNEDVRKFLREEFIKLSSLEPQKRGYAFQEFLITLFESYGLKPKSAFRLVGEEIDGSFELHANTYLLEAKWQSVASGQKDLAAFSIKVSGKSIWSRGLFISYAGYSQEGLEAFAKGKQTNIIGMDGQDIFFILDGKLQLDEAIQLKARKAAETNEFFCSVFHLANS